MEAHEYQTLFDVETTCWWFRALRGVLLDTCRRVGLTQTSRILDAGCGTGKLVDVMRKAVSPQTIGFDGSRCAAPYWRQRRLHSLCVASTNEIPFRDASFDAVLAVDLLECDSVDERQAAQELCRVLRPGGYLLLVVPACDWLMSPEHHRAVHASRRYTQDRVRRLLDCAPVRIVQTTHLFFSLFGPIALYRGLGPRRRWEGNGPPRSELRLFREPLNELLFRAVDWERRLLPHVNFPIGSSILAVAQKAEA